MKAQKLNQRQARWSLYLSRFDFALKHVAGKSIGRADSVKIVDGGLYFIFLFHFYFTFLFFFF